MKFSKVISIVINNKVVKSYNISEKHLNKRFIIGSSSKFSQIVIDKDIVSRKHLELLITANGIMVTDLNSTNGIFINGQRIQSGVRKKTIDNDIISLDKSNTVNIIISQHIVQNTPNATNDTEKTQFSNHQSERIWIGRGKDCQIRFETELLSRRHAYLIKNNDNTYTIVDNNSTNGTYINGHLLTGEKKITKFDKIKIGGFSFTLQDYLSDKSLSTVRKASKKTVNLTQLLTTKNEIVIGRSKKCDYVIKDNSVSRLHARIIKKNNRYYIEDLKSVNGTFVNNKLINKITQISENDSIRISFMVFKLNGNTTDISEYSAIRATQLTKIFPTKNGEYVAVKPISFNIPSKSFIALMGPSGCGKTTLMNMINGFNPATTGKVYIHGLELIENINLLKQKIGYVPQDDIVHKDLRVDNALFYAAKLRMNKDTTDEEIRHRINVVCQNLRITKEQRQEYIKKLSGGQRKRISIAVELLNKPSILFLDEPTSPLDPETIDSFLTSLKELAQKENTTIVMVTHKPEDLKYVDRVIFLGNEGYPAYYGSEQNLFGYFKVDNIVKIYARLSNNKEAIKWYEVYKRNNSTDNDNYQADQGLGNNKKQKVSIFNQFYWLTRRYANLKWNDKNNIVLLLLQPILVPLALVFIYEKLELGILFLMAITSIWFGVSNAAKEIVEEVPIYIRERMYNLKIFPYVISKLFVLSIIALVQVILYVIVLYLKYGASSGVPLVNIPDIILYMFYLTFSATLLGLLLSVVFKTSEQVMSIIPIVLIPQIIFAGVISKVDTRNKEMISYVMFGRWGTEGLARIQSNHEDFKTYVYKPNDELVIMNSEDEKHKINLVTVDEVCSEGSDNGIIECKPIYKSVFQKRPRVLISNDTLKVVDEPENAKSRRPMIIENKKVYTEPIVYNKGEEYVKVNPIDVLGFYKNNKLLNIFNSLSKNILAIFIIDISLFLLTLFFLKKKDKI